EQQVDKLPTQKIYDKFENGDNCVHLGRGNAKDEIVRGVNIALNVKHITDVKLATDIVNAWCHACSLGKEDVPSPNDAFHFLFYWIGDRIKRNLGDLTFYEVMIAAYHNLSSGQCNKRSIIYNDIIEPFFTWAKDLWDYEYNIRTLKEREDCSEYKSNFKFIEKLEKAKEAYKELCDRCGKSDYSGNSYCIEFKSKHIDRGKCIDGELTELNCKTIQKPLVSSSGAVVTNEVQLDQDPGSAGLTAGSKNMCI
ncbi:hypothetical protein PCYB_003350, partial [Plasmodium cynomolgi strain B]